jgi:hypothetical protein
MMIPLTAITTFLKIELVFAARGVRRWPGRVTVVTTSVKARS